MTVLTTIPNGASLKDVRDTLNDILAKMSGGGSGSGSTGRYVTMTGAAAQNFRTPATTTNQPEGFVDMTAIVMITEMATAGAVRIIGASHFLYLTNDRKLGLIYYNGSSPQFVTPGTAGQLPADFVGKKIWLRVIINTTSAAVTANGQTVQSKGVAFLYSYDGSTWTLMTTVGGVNALMTGGSPNGGYPLGVGSGDSDGNAGKSLIGRVYGARITDATGAVVASPDATAQAAGTASFADAQGNTWTVVAPAALS